MGEGGPGLPVLPVDHEGFCEALADEEPNNCDVDDPPSTPGIDPFWQGNGCGSGGIIGDWAATHMMDILDVPGWSGNLDAPLPGVSFLSACNAHDECYYSSAKSWCDTTFFGSMGGICNGVPAYQYDSCMDFAYIYRGAVGTHFGDDAWQENHDARQCALWAQDMQQNECVP